MNSKNDNGTHIKESEIHTNGSVKILSYDSIDSTNSCAVRMAKEGELDSYDVPVLITAGEQTGGRGRYGRNFLSPKGSGIYITYCFRPCFPAADFTAITAVTAVAVHDAILEVTGRESSVKWVNDICMNGLKLGGILTEGIARPGAAEINYIAIGIGINCYKFDIPEDIAGKAGYITDDTNEFSREKLIAAIANRLDDAFCGKVSLDLPFYRNEYIKHCSTIGKTVKVFPAGGESCIAKAVGIREDFAIELEILTGPLKGNVTAMSSGEVSLELE